MRKLLWIPLLAAAGCTAGPRTTPFQGKVHIIPGTIEAEHFDEGDEGTAYHDVDEKNQGVPYRAGRVDIEERKDASNGHGVGWTKAGEWLAYTVLVETAGTYTIEIPVASNKKGGTFHIEFGGADKTGPIDVPDTGGWQVLKVITKTGVKLDAGRHVMRVVLDTNGASKSVADIDLYRFSR